MPGPRPLIRRAGKLILNSDITVPVLKAIRRHIVKVSSFNQIIQRTAVIRQQAVNLMQRLSDEVDIYDRLARRCGKFNKHVAELLIVRDYDILKDVAPIRVAYQSLQFAAHHIILQSEFKNYSKHFALLSKRIGKGWWSSSDKMPAMALFQELHGLSPETLKAAYKMNTSTLDLVQNFSPSLTEYVQTNKRSGTFKELFELHRNWYSENMNKRFYEDKKLPGLGARSLREWLDEMISIAGQIDVELGT